MHIVAEYKGKARIGLYTLLILTMALLVACGSKQAETQPAPQEPEASVVEPASLPIESAPPRESVAPEPQTSQPQTSTQATSSQSETEPAPEPASEPAAKASTSDSTQGMTTESEAKVEPSETESESAIEEPMVNLEEVDAVDDIFFLEIISPEEDPTFAETSTFTVFGRTRVDAAVSVNDTLVDVDQDGILEATVDLEEGPNIIEVVASVSGGEEESAVLTVFYIP